MTDRSTRSGEPLPEALEAACEHCLSCNACRSVCPVQLATNRLAPLQLLRTAAMGLAPPLPATPRNLGTASNAIGAATSAPCRFVLRYSSAGFVSNAVQLGYVSEETLLRFEALQVRFQRVRWHMIATNAEGAQLEEMGAAVASLVGRADTMSRAKRSLGALRSLPRTFRPISALHASWPRA